MHNDGAVRLLPEFRRQLCSGKIPSHSHVVFANRSLAVPFVIQTMPFHGFRYARSKCPRHLSSTSIKPRQNHATLNFGLIWKSSHEIDVASMPKAPMPALRTPFKLLTVFIWLSIFPKLSSECWKGTVPNCIWVGYQRTRRSNLRLRRRVLQPNNRLKSSQRRQRRLERYQEVVELNRSGYSQRAIADRLHMEAEDRPSFSPCRWFSRAKTAEKSSAKS